MFLSFCFSPIEQFDIIPLINLNFGIIDFSITNQTVILFLIYFFIFTLLFSSTNEDSTLSITPNRWQAPIELMYKAILSMLVTNVGKDTGKPFFPLFFSIFFFVINVNLIGLIPYSFTLTSHIIVTFSLSLFFFHWNKYHLYSNSWIKVFFPIFTIGNFCSFRTIISSY